RRRDRRSEGDARRARVQCTDASMSRRAASTQDDKPSSRTSAAACPTGEGGRSQVKSLDPRAQALAPDLEAIGGFIREMIKRGAIIELIASVVALLQRMREINTELMARIATKSRKRPPSEKLGRLQLELPLLFGAIANDTACAELEGPPEPPTTDAPPKDEIGRAHV